MNFDVNAWSGSTLLILFLALKPVLFFRIVIKHMCRSKVFGIYLIAWLNFRELRYSVYEKVSSGKFP